MISFSMTSPATLSPFVVAADLQHCCCFVGLIFTMWPVCDCVPSKNDLWMKVTSKLAQVHFRLTETKCCRRNRQSLKCINSKFDNGFVVCEFSRYMVVCFEEICCITTWWVVECMRWCGTSEFLGKTFRKHYPNPASWPRVSQNCMCLGTKNSTFQLPSSNASFKSMEKRCQRRNTQNPFKFRAVLAVSTIKQEWTKRKSCSLPIYCFKNEHVPSFNHFFERSMSKRGDDFSHAMKQVETKVWTITSHNTL